MKNLLKIDFKHHKVEIFNPDMFIYISSNSEYKEDWYVVLDSNTWLSSENMKWDVFISLWDKEFFHLSEENQTIISLNTYCEEYKPSYFIQ